MTDQKVVDAFLERAQVYMDGIMVDGVYYDFDKDGWLRGPDGIPRRITDDGRIMKCDWSLSKELLEDNLEGEALEEHIAKLMREQSATEI